MTEPSAIQAAAERLWTALSDRQPCAPVRDLLEPGDIDAAYAVQQELGRRRLAYGHPAADPARPRARRGRVVGRKIGLTSRAVQRQLGVDQPDFGTIFADMVYADAEPVPIDRLLQPKAEGELAFLIGDDLDRPDLAPHELIDAIDGALPAIEVVDSRIADWDLTIVDTIADNASAGVVVLGSTPVPLGAFDPRLCGMVLERRGDPVSTGAGAACLGNPITAVLWLARTLARRGTPLQAGDLVLSGALGPMVDVAAGDVLDLRIAGVGRVRAAFEGAA